MRKRTLAAVAALISATIAFLLIWALWTFTAWEADPANWPDPARFIFFVAAFIGPIVAGFAAVEIVNDQFDE